MSPDRDANGRFALGNPGGPGRPRRVVEADYLAALSEAVPLEKWHEIVETAVDQAVSGDAKAREWIGSYLAGKPTGNALRRLAAAEAEEAGTVRIHGHLADGHKAEREAALVEPGTPDAHEDLARRGDEMDALAIRALDVEAALRPAQRVALATLVHGATASDVARSAGVTPGTVRRWLRSDPPFIAAFNVALAERENRPRQALAALAAKAVAVVREALHGYAEPGELKAAVEVVKLLKLNQPAPDRATDRASAERAIMRRQHDQWMEDLLTPAPSSWRNGDGDEEDEEDE
jgi:hypothetical protein